MSVWEAKSGKHKVGTINAGEVFTVTYTTFISNKQILIGQISHNQWILMGSAEDKYQNQDQNWKKVVTKRTVELAGVHVLHRFQVHHEPLWDELCGLKVLKPGNVTTAPMSSDEIKQMLSFVPSQREKEMMELQHFYI